MRFSYWIDGFIAASATLTMGPLDDEALPVGSTFMRRSGSIAFGQGARSNQALGNLRGIVILIVLAFHSVLAYLNWIPRVSAAFTSPPFGWRAFPIVDSERFFGFDLFCAWQDVYLMSLMFFLSGLFVWPSLTRRTEWGFVRDRALRLGLPFLFGILILMPLALYPAYSARTADPSLAGYWHDWFALPFWPNGQVWFLWQLLALNLAVAGVHGTAPNALKSLGRWSGEAGARPLVFFAVLVAVSACVYVPMALAFTPWSWSDSGFLAVQWCRPLHYAVYFFAGVGIGVEGIERGLVAADGALARRWALWLAAALASLFVWMGLTALTMNGDAALGVRAAADLAFVVACACGCFFVIAASLRFATRQSPILDGLSANAYSLYLVHYNFVIWLQFALLSTALFAVVKGAIVFCGTLLLSFIATLVFAHLPFGDRLIGAPHRSTAVSWSANPR
jgi:glucans biosynthesis protein C